MPTNCRLQRGHRGMKSGCGGCGVPESINHVLQYCFIISVLKTVRHKALLRNLSGVLQRKGYEVDWEPQMRTTEGLRKQDLVATMGHLALVIDAHIVSDKIDMISIRIR